MARTKQVKRLLNGVSKAERDALVNLRTIKQEAIIVAIRALDTDNALRLIVRASNLNVSALARKLRQHEDEDDDEDDEDKVPDVAPPITDKLVLKLIEFKKESTDKWTPTPTELLFAVTVNVSLFNAPGNGDVMECMEKLEQVIKRMRKDGTYNDAPEADSMWEILGHGNELPQDASWDLLTLQTLVMEEVDRWPGWLEQAAMDKRSELRAIYVDT